MYLKFAHCKNKSNFFHLSILFCTDRRSEEERYMVYLQKEKVCCSVKYDFQIKTFLPETLLNSDMVVAIVT